MELVYAFLADAAQFTPDGKLNMLGGDFNSINTDDFPHIHAVIAVAMRFRLTREETAVEHPVIVELRSIDTPEADIITQVRGSFPPSIVPDTADGPFFVSNVANLMMTVFQTPGIYSVRIVADGRLVAEYPITVAGRLMAEENVENGS